MTQAASEASSSAGARMRMKRNPPLEKHEWPPPQGGLQCIAAQPAGPFNQTDVDLCKRYLRAAAGFALAVQRHVVVGDVERDALGEVVDRTFQCVVLEGLETAATVAHEVVVMAGALRLV